MFYYLIYNSSFSNYQMDLNKKYITTILYGSILYILLHAYLSISSSMFIQQLKPYFWLILCLDIASIFYIYSSMNTSNDINSSISKIRDTLQSYLKNNMDTSTSNIHNSLNLKTPMNDTEINMSNNTTTISPTTGLDNKLNSTTTSLISSTNDGISYSTTLEDLKFIEQQQKILVEPPTTHATSKILKNKLSNEMDEMLKQKINTHGNANANAHVNTEDIDGNGSDCGSDLGSVVDIDIKEFEAML